MLWVHQEGLEPSTDRLEGRLLYPAELLVHTFAEAFSATFNRVQYSLYREPCKPFIDILGVSI